MSGFNRNYCCHHCGKMRRAPAHYIPNGPQPPHCCEQPMTMLSHEQTEAATHIVEAERVEWLAVGAKVIERGGKRSWKAFW